MPLSRWLTCFALAVALLATLGPMGCERRADPLPPPDVNATAPVEEHDAEMEAAMERARRDIDTFIVALATPPDARTSDPMLKVPLESPDGVTHYVWLGDVQYDNGTFSGILVEQPLADTGARPGERISVRREQVADWVYEENNQRVGGYTWQVLYSRMTEEERRQMQEVMPIE